MAYTKLQLIQSAFGEIGLPYYTFDIQPERYEDALHRMDGMVAGWMGRGLQFGYNFAASINEDSGVSLADHSAIYLNLSLSIAPGLGKIPAPETKTAAALALDTMYIRAAQPQQRQMPGDLPRGEGQKPWRTVFYPFFPTPNVSPVSTPQTDNFDIAKD